MARLSLNKAQLAREKGSLAMYRRYLPSLDLKRKQLMAERKKTEARLAEIDAAIAERIETIGAEIPMLANTDIDLDGLARLTKVEIGERNMVGQRLPVVESVEIEIAAYGKLNRPHWVDLVAARLHEVITLRIESQVTARQIALLNAAVRTVTQRVNLFEKVLIPRAQANMRRIQIALSDQDRSSVVTSKIAKRKREAAAA
ncbi:MAG: V-type ATP synthase subunit D [Pseudomonadota bacterium]